MHMLSKRIIAMALTLLMLLSGISAFAAVDTVELEAVNAEYLRSEVVVIKGNTTLANVTVNLVNPAGGSVHYRTATKNELAEGIYLQIPANAIYGTYKVLVGTEAVTEKLEFKVVDGTPDAGVVLDEINENYLRGEVVLIKGTTTFPAVSLTIANENGGPVLSKTISKAELEKGYEVLINEKFEFGKYKIVIGTSKHTVVKTFNVVEKLEEIKVVGLEEISLEMPVGTSLEEVLAELPDKVIATLSDDSTIEVEVKDWSSEDFDSEKAGEYTFTAEVVEVEGVDLDEFTTATAKVTLVEVVEDRKVVELEEIKVIMAIGSTLEDVIASLPDEVTAILEDESKVKLSVGQWSSEDFEADTEGTFTFTAPIEPMAGIDLGEFTQATATVVVSEKFSVVSIESLDDYYPVEKGKTVEYVKTELLPQTIKATIENNNGDKLEVNVPVQWNEKEKYLPNFVKDSQLFLGTLQYEDYIEADKKFKTVSAYVWVEVPVSEFRVPSTITVNVGRTYKISPTIKPNDASKVNVVYSTSDTRYATVDKSGVVRGVRQGTAYITVTLTDNTKFGGVYTEEIRVNVRASTTSRTPTTTTDDIVIIQPPQPPKHRFLDISTVAWAHDAISKLYEAGIILGRSDTEFAPNDLVTRAEFLTMLTKAVGVYNPNASTDKFSDVNAGDWYMSYVASAAAVGITQGYEDGTFRPNQHITRQEMAVLTYRAAKNAGIPITAVRAQVEFTDNDEIADWAKESVYEMQKAGIINGMGDGTYAPLQNATRAQSAVIIYGIYSKK